VFNQVLATVTRKLSVSLCVFRAPLQLEDGGELLEYDFDRVRPGTLASELRHSAETLSVDCWLEGYVDNGNTREWKSYPAHEGAWWVCLCSRLYCRLAALRLSSFVLTTEHQFPLLRLGWIPVSASFHSSR
jgi:hypothetical protein